MVFLPRLLNPLSWFSLSFPAENRYLLISPILKQLVFICKSTDILLSWSVFLQHLLALFVLLISESASLSWLVCLSSHWDSSSSECQRSFITFLNQNLCLSLFYLIVFITLSKYAKKRNSLDFLITSGKYIKILLIFIASLFKLFALIDYARRTSSFSMCHFHDNTLHIDKVFICSFHFIVLALILKLPNCHKFIAFVLSLSELAWLTVENVTSLVFLCTNGQSWRTRVEKYCWVHYNWCLVVVGLFILTQKYYWPYCFCHCGVSLKSFKINFKIRL